MKKVIFVLMVTLIACEKIAVFTAEEKKPVFAQSEKAMDANTYFWNNFHAGNYDSLNRVIEKLLGVLSENPDDLITTDHLGFAYIWALSERQRLSKPDHLISQNIYLSKRFFEESYHMNTHDPRIMGFLADISLTEGATLKNAKEQTAAYFMGLESVKQWPQFNKFTVGYALSILPKDNKNFQLGLKWQYESMSDCACEVPDATKMTDQKKTEAVLNAKTEQVKRACTNSWIAPHNLEGFFLNFGDMLVKNGQWKEAIKIYSLARIPKSYSTWIYKDTLEERIKSAEENTIEFNKPLNESNLSNQRVIMVNSRFSCTGCHGVSKEEQILMGNSKPPLEYYFTKERL